MQSFVAPTNSCLQDKMGPSKSLIVQSAISATSVCPNTIPPAAMYVVTILQPNAPLTCPIPSFTINPRSFLFFAHPCERQQQPKMPHTASKGSDPGCTSNYSLPT